VSRTPDRDRQFGYINRTAKEFLKRKEPVISVDTRRKERAGNFKNNGRRWHKKGQAPKVNVHDMRVWQRARLCLTEPMTSIET
jgi:Rhodopirellula transposase DDE domain